MFTKRVVSFQEHTDTSLFYSEGKMNPFICLSEQEHKSVKRAFRDFLADWERVTGEKPQKAAAIPAERKERMIVIGTVETSELLRELEDAGKIDLSDLRGKWESYTIEVIKQRYEHVDEILVIAGSDNRGAIYGMYEISEQMGVSPWYWWMDVPIVKRKQLYFKQGKYQQGEPSVKYRGFFINDEGPSLMTWVRDKFPDFTHEFYSHVFELTLRLKANYHWPAMWDSSFYEDDELNAETADLYGVVMGTSHHEPMARPHEDWKRHRNGPWDYHQNAAVLRDFWSEGIDRSKNYENILTIGMRGDGDEAMDSGFTFEDHIKLMEKIIADQRDIIAAHHQQDAAEVPQLWALYKEVMDYYEAGLSVPDDVTLLWSDDNFGNLRRVPTHEERKRSGGAGIYYHLDYVGGPRSYKWVGTVPLAKIWEQMHKAYHYGADRIWILNVGDIKPMEFQMTFFLKMAWDMDAFSATNLDSYSVEWAKSTFGETHAQEIATVLNCYAYMNGRIKPEHLNGGPLYHWENYDEAKRELARFEKIVAQAEHVLSNLPEAYRSAFYQVGYYPAKASYNVLKMYQLSALNQKYAKEGRITTNDLAAEVERLYEEDQQLTDAYHRLSDGKWNHMMLQTHIGYTYWQQPEENVMPPVTRIENQISSIKIDSPAHYQLSNYDGAEPFVEIYNTGSEPLEFRLESSVNWLNITEHKGKLVDQKRLFFTVDWESFEADEKKQGTITLFNNEDQVGSFTITAEKLSLEADQVGHIESNSYISIEAGSYVENVSQGEIGWEEVPSYGRTNSTMVFIPKAGDENLNWKERNSYPVLKYRFYLSQACEANLQLITTPSLPYVVGDHAKIGVSFDDDKMHVLDTVTLENGQPHEQEWEESVIQSCRIARLEGCKLAAGWHTLQVHMLSPVVGLQKILIDCGGLQDSFLGAPESLQVGRRKS